MHWSIVQGLPSLGSQSTAKAQAPVAGLHESTVQVLASSQMRGLKTQAAFSQKSVVQSSESLQMIGLL
jgi:hypothetical protein